MEQAFAAAVEVLATPPLGGVANLAPPTRVGTQLALVSTTLSMRDL